MWLKIGEKLGFKVGRIMFKMKRGDRIRVFIFQIFHVMPRHGLGMLRHVMKTRVLKRLSMPRHKGIMSRHVAIGFLYADVSCRDTRESCRSMLLSGFCMGFGHAAA